MEKIKRFLTLFLSMMMVCCMLDAEPVYGKSEVDITKPVTLTWYFIGNGPQKDTAKVEKKIHEYLMKKYKMNTSVKLICYDWGSYPKKINNIINSKQKFDICFTSSWVNNYYIQADKGAYIPLNDLLPKYAPKTKALLGESYLKGAEINDTLYAIPANKEKAYQVGLVLRKDLVTKYNMDITKIKNFSDVEPLLALIKEKEPKVEPLEVIIENDLIFKILNFERIGDGVYPGVIYTDSKDMKIFNEFEKPETQDFLKTMHRFYELGYVCKEIGDYFGQTHLEENGQVFAGIDSICPGKLNDLKDQNGYDWVAVPLSPTVITNSEAIGSMQAISATSPNPERALMFLELVNTDEYLNNLINFGIENEHYVKTGEKSIKLTQDANRYDFQMGWMFGNQLLNYRLPGQGPDYWDAFKAFNAKAQPSKILGFVFNTWDIQKEVKACSYVWDKYMPALIVGAVDPDVYLPKMLEDFKKAGSDKVIAEIQIQLDEWQKQHSK